ncbi:Lipase GDSL [Penicillium sp. DV-2018c]|nr:Lipase GDSL [Penicillium sp. DV-2018c]
MVYSCSLIISEPTEFELHDLSVLGQELIMKQKGPGKVEASTYIPSHFVGYAQMAAAAADVPYIVDSYFPRHHTHQPSATNLRFSCGPGILQGRGLRECHIEEVSDDHVHLSPIRVCK